jgi:nucleoside-diphosphate-sugar epimerase
MVSEYFGKKPLFNSKIEFRLGDIRHAISSSEKLKKLGWKPAVPESKSVKLYLDWFVSQKHDIENFIKIQELIRNQGVILTIN